VAEVVTLVRSPTGAFDEGRAVLERGLGRGQYPDLVDLQHVGAAELERATDVFERVHDQPLGSTDATTIAVVETADIDSLLAFEDGFDGLVDRIDPQDR